MTAGPVTLPCPVHLGGADYLIRSAPPFDVCRLAATGQWTALAEVMLGPDWPRVADRIADPADVLDTEHVDELAITALPVVAGFGTGLLAWRAVMHLSGYLVREWLDVSGQLIAMGVDPVADPLWRVMLSLRHIIVSAVDPMDRDWIREQMEQPLRIEPAMWRDSPGRSQDAYDRQRRAFDEMME